MSEYFPFDPNPRPPKVMPPPMSCDCQFHALGSEDRYPPKPDANYRMPDATIAKALEMHKTLGIERGIIVQPTTYGFDHQVTIDALKVAGPNYRGCAIAMVLENKPESYIASLHDAGVRGGRFNFLPQLNMVPTPEKLARLVSHLKELGWYAKIQPPRTGIMDTVHLIEGIKDIPVIIDHMGRATAKEGINSPTVKKLVELLKKGNFWILLSNGHKYSARNGIWDDMIPIARAFIEAAPDRILWASDWPHPVSTTQPPNDGDLIELLYSYTNSDEELKNILVENPALLLFKD